MRVAVLGAGNGGVASAFDFAQHGHDVALYAPPEHGENIVAVAAAGGIAARGDLEGFVPIRYAGHDAAEALDGAELVLVVGPAYATEPLAVDAGPHLSDGTAVLVCPGSCAGAIAFKRAVGLELGDERYTVGETSTLPYAVRVVEPGRRQRLPQAHRRAVRRRPAAIGNRPAARAHPGGLAGRREGRQRLPDHAAERQPGHPPGGHAAQRRADSSGPAAASCSTRRASPRASAG